MGRIKIEMPEKFNFTCEIKVRVTDLNYGGHLGNDRLLTLMHEARVDYLKSLGFEGEMNIGGKGIIMTDAAIIYKSEAFHNDILKIEVGVGEFNSFGCDLYYRITQQTTAREVALAKTGIVFFNYEIRKLSKIPEIFLERVNNS